MNEPQKRYAEGRQAGSVDRARDSLPWGHEFAPHVWARVYLKQTKHYAE